MALDVTIGTLTSESYADVAFLDAYAVGMNNASWAAKSLSEKEALARKGTAWLDGTYQLYYSGTRTNGRNQVLGFPRVDAADYDGNDLDSAAIPIELKKALGEICLAGVADPTIFDRKIDPTKIVASVKIGPIERKLFDNSGKDATDLMIYLGAVHAMMVPIIRRSKAYAVAVVV